MKIKKFEAPSEQEAIEKVKNELGTEALILNIRKIQPKGLRAIFVRPYVEVTAAYKESAIVPEEYDVNKFEDVIVKQKEKTKVLAGIDEDLYERNEYKPEDYTKYLQEEPEPHIDFQTPDEDVFLKESPAIIRKDIITKERKSDERIRIETLERQLESTENMLKSVMDELTVAKREKGFASGRYDNQMIQVFFDTLVKQGVYPEIAEKILAEADMIDDKDKIDISFVVKLVYNKILNILGKPETICIQDAGKTDAKVVAFMGPTGVGKTTTIAKLSSNFILNEDLYVGLITADTYRIAAIEQLKTYAEILNIEISVVYDNLELVDDIIVMNKTNDVIFIDTAGRAHSNEMMMDELRELLQYIEDSERYLVLSLTTKCEDLIDIVNKYSEVSDFKIIFTKSDETKYFGSILNLCYLTGKKLSYLTTGQNVPDDIEVFNPEKIAKALLGLGGE